jgi:hypothetical protein
MFINPKELQDYWNEAYYLEWIDKIEVDGVTVKGHWSEPPIYFRYKKLKIVNEDMQNQEGRLGVDITATYETRFDLPFKTKDLILDDLETLPLGQTYKNGLRFKNFSRILKVDKDIQQEDSMINLMFNSNIDVVYTLVIS